MFARAASSGRWKLARHLHLIDRVITDAIIKPPHRALISCPPRHGKSEHLSKYLPAWFLGSFPDRRVILASYEADFAASWGRKARQVLEEYGDWFGVKVSGRSSAADRWDIEGREGGMMTAGVGGPITGKGADLLIIDDPVKNAEEAGSKTYRDRAWDWWRSVAYTRLEPTGVAIVIQTRWHDDDLTGRIIKDSAAGGEAWRVVNLPALAESADQLGRKPGEALWPWRFDAPKLRTIERTLGSYLWSALYQQRPVPAEGALFKAPWLRHWCYLGPTIIRKYPDGRREKANPDTFRVFITVDLATSLKTSADFTVIAVWGDDGKGNLYLLDMVRERMEGPDIVPCIKRLVAHWKAQYVGIESTGYQLSTVQAARREGLPVRELRRKADKVTRAIPATVRMESEQVWLPEHASWLADVTSELLQFPAGAHDDFVDVLADAANEMTELYSKTKGRTMPSLGSPGQGSPNQPSQWR